MMTRIENENLTNKQGIVLECRCGCKKIKLESTTEYDYWDESTSVNLHLVCKGCGRRQWIHGYYAE